MPGMEQLSQALTIVGTAAMLFTLAIKAIAYWLRLRAWDRHEERKRLAKSQAEQAVLTAPPEMPESLSRHTVFAFFLGSAALGLGLIVRPPIRPMLARPESPAVPTLVPPPEPDMTLAPPMELAQHCTESKDCGYGCRCVSRSCVCAAEERKPGKSKGRQPKGSGSGSRPQQDEPGASSGLASLCGQPMAGEVAWTGTL